MFFAENFFTQMTIVLASNSPPAAFKPTERYDTPPTMEKTSPVKNFEYEEKKKTDYASRTVSPGKKSIMANKKTIH